jgi:hypothetical protein
MGGGDCAGGRGEEPKKKRERPRTHDCEVGDRRRATILRVFLSGDLKGSRSSKDEVDAVILVSVLDIGVVSSNDEVVVLVQRLERSRPVRILVDDASKEKKSSQLFFTFLVFFAF